jgi:hypothetical protein
MRSQIVNLWKAQSLEPKIKCDRDDQTTIRNTVGENYVHPSIMLKTSGCFSPNFSQGGKKWSQEPARMQLPQSF